MKESDSTDTGIVIDGVCLQKDEKEYKKKIDVYKRQVHSSCGVRIWHFMR